ncbi:MAG TPA: isochorismate synthase [Alcaligenes sp.]|nr:isochorismate synthase [Alcaligenes sp.]HRL26154.1 isochorismate synthase [Alcaligenes sp.]
MTTGTQNDVRAATIEQWLQHYEAGSTVFASPTVSLLAQGTALELRADNAQGQLQTHAQRLLEQARQNGMEAPLLLGVIPFNPARPAYLRVPVSYRRDPVLRRPVQRPPLARSANTVLAQSLLPDGPGYEDSVARILTTMRERHIHKTVMARTVSITLDQPLDRLTVLRNMLHSNPAGYTYAMPLPEGNVHDPSTFFGASPELLVRRQGEWVTVNPLAGTAPRHADPRLDQASAEALMASAKDQREHAYVIDDVVRILSHFCEDLDVPPGPSLTSTANLWHLSTRVRARLRNPDISSLELALAMHPTPAVCGQPTAAAMQAIEATECFDRGYFAGAIGWSDSRGNGEWAVAIRCAHYAQQRLTLSAGAGIVEGSRPELERQETGNKLLTLIHSLGLAQDITL